MDDVDGIDGAEHAGFPHDLRQSENAEHCEPDHHDRSEQPSDGRRAVPLDGKQRGDQRKRNRDHIGFEQGGCDFKALNRAQHRNGGVMTQSP